MKGSASAAVLGLLVMGSLTLIFKLQTAPKSDTLPAQPAAEAPNTPRPSETIHIVRGDTPNTSPVQQTSPALVDIVQSRLAVWRLEPNPETQIKLMEELLALLNATNAAAITRSLSPDDFESSFGTAALDEWAKQDSQAAADWLATRPDANSEHAAILARNLLNEPSTLQTYCNSLPGGDWKQRMLAAAAFESAAQNPERAITFAIQMAPGETQAGALQSSAFEWARRDPGAAIDWVSQVEDAGLRERLAASAAKGLASSDPRQAAEWLVSSVKDSELLNEAAPGIVRSWAASDPSAAAEWIARFPESQIRTEVADTLVSFWATSSFEAAARWVQSLPEGSLRQHAANVLARMAPAQVAAP